MPASTRAVTTVSTDNEGEDLELVDLVDLVDRLIEGGLQVHGHAGALPR